MTTGPPAVVADLTIPSDPKAAVTINLEPHAVKAALVERDSVNSLDAKAWDVPGVYVLIGPLGGKITEVYVGKAGGGKQGVRGRLQTHKTSPRKNANFPWWRAVAFLRDTTDGFDSAQVGYLEGRVASELGALPGVKVRSDREDIDRSQNAGKRAALDALVPSILAGLKLVGLPLREDPPEGPADAQASSGDKVKQNWYGVAVADLVADGLIEPGEVLTFRRKGVDAIATVTAEGALVVDGVAYQSPSEAGKVAHGLKNRVRGWTDWRLDGGSGSSLHEIRQTFLEKNPSG